jgi:plastocyanin
MRMWKPLSAAAVLALLSGDGAAAAATIEITIDKMTFSPAQVDAKVGDTVLWTNKDAFVHTATVKGAWEIMLPQQKTGSMVMKTSGSVEYYCRFHPNMKGRVNVSP